MTELRPRNRGHDGVREAAVWIDHDQAVIVERGLDDKDTVEHVDRFPAESEPTFEARAIHEIINRDRVVVSGPDDARLGFERAYVALTHRPDRLVDGDDQRPPRGAVA